MPQRAPLCRKIPYASELVKFDLNRLHGTLKDAKAENAGSPAQHKSPTEALRASSFLAA